MAQLQAQLRGPPRLGAGRRAAGTLLAPTGADRDDVSATRAGARKTLYYPLAMLTLLLSAADHWTTYLCLRRPIEGWTVTEANPIAEWLFSTVGLVPGLLIDSAITVWAIVFLLTTRRFPRVLKVGFFSLVAAWTAHAVINNLQAIASLGLSPLGGV